MSGKPDVITLEYDLVDGFDKKLLLRMMVIERENQFTWKSVFSLWPKNHPPEELISDALHEQLDLYLNTSTRK